MNAAQSALAQLLKDLVTQATAKDRLFSPKGTRYLEFNAATGREGWALRRHDKMLLIPSEQHLKTLRRERPSKSVSVTLRQLLHAQADEAPVTIVEEASGDGKRGLAITGENLDRRFRRITPEQIDALVQENDTPDLDAEKPKSWLETLPKIS